MCTMVVILVCSGGFGPDMPAVVPGMPMGGLLLNIVQISLHLSEAAEDV